MRPSTQHIQVSSIESYTEMLQDLDIIAYQTSKGEFISNHTFISLPSMQLLKRKMNNSTVHHGILSADMFYFVIPEEHINILVNGVELSHQELYIIGENEEQLSRFPNNFTGYAVSIEKGYLTKYINQATINFLLNHTEKIRSGRLQLTNLLHFKSNIVNTIKFALKNCHLLSHIAIADLQEKIALELCYLFEPLIGSKSVNVLGNQRYLIVKRVLEYLDENPKATPNISSLIGIAFCSLRTLEYAFKTTYNLTPKEFLKIRRLHLIHTELRHFKAIKIRDVAEKYGIVNLGRFSQDYYQLFGELPKETLHSK